MSLSASNAAEVLRASDLKYAVCFLVINSITELPKLAISSCLRVTKCPIIVGYLNEKDLQDLPIDSRITYLKLDIPREFLAEFSTTNRNYRTFDEQEFFKIVTVKWQLFKRLIELDIETLVYSDLDVIWIRDAAREIDISFKRFQTLDVLIQSIPSAPSEPKLCMGIVGFRIGKNVHDLIFAAHDIHLRQVMLGNKFGDDDAITEYYRSNGSPHWIRELPQTAFPVGKLLNSFSNKQLMPGLYLETPYIFHANYISGVRNKRLMLRIFLKNQDLNVFEIRLSIFWYMILITKRIRHKIRLGRFLKRDR
jgi:hypothetical protein